MKFHGVRWRLLTGEGKECLEVGGRRKMVENLKIRDVRDQISSANNNERGGWYGFGGCWWTDVDTWEMVASSIGMDMSIGIGWAKVAEMMLKASFEIGAPPKNYKDTYDDVDEDFSTVIHPQNDYILPRIHQSDLGKESQNDYYRVNVAVTVVVKKKNVIRVRTPQTLVETHRNNQPRSSSTAESLPTESASFSDHPRRIQARSTAAKSSNKYIYASLSQCIRLYIRNLVGLLAATAMSISTLTTVLESCPNKKSSSDTRKVLWRKLNGQHSTKGNQQFLILN
ncbi:hypothetical protein LXL04_034062 [Taraxacum kok-saghyz]